jgi:hypothetical protein
MLRAWSEAALESAIRTAKRNLRMVQEGLR